MKKIYREPEIEVVVFSKRDQIKASTIVYPDPVKSAVENPLGDAEGDAEGFFWY